MLRSVFDDNQTFHQSEVLRQSCLDYMRKSISLVLSEVRFLASFLDENPLSSCNNSFWRLCPCRIQTELSPKVKQSNCLKTL
jgi:ferredoxin-thioredoxin reductase catalytic subunit